MPASARRAAAAVVLGTLVLLLLARWTIAGGLRQLPRAPTFAQRAETGIQITYGLLSLLVIVTRFRWHRWGPAVGVAWLVSLAATAWFSSMAWGPPMPLVGAVFATGALLLAWGILRVLGSDRAA